MPVLIVDPLEVVEIEQQHGGIPPLSGAQLPCEDLTEMTAVEDPGDRVLAGEPLGVRAGALELRFASRLARGMRQLGGALRGQLECVVSPAARVRSIRATVKVSAPPITKISQGRSSSVVVSDPPATLTVQARPGVAIAARTALSRPEPIVARGVTWSRS